MSGWDQLTRALTLTQPWAGLVASGIKLIENRPRSMIKVEDFGKPFAIHASREISKQAMRRIIEIAPELCDPTRNPWFELGARTSAIVGVATIDRMIRCSTSGTPVAGQLFDQLEALGDQRRWFFGPVGYVLRDVRALKTPIPCRGFQGFWTMPDDVRTAVLNQLGAAS